MRRPHQNKQFVIDIIKNLGSDSSATLIAAEFKTLYPELEMPSPRTIANIKKEYLTQQAPSNLCPNCRGYGYLYEQTKTYFGDGTETPFLKDVMAGTYVEVSCHSCENSGIDPNWERPRSTLQSLATPEQPAAAVQDQWRPATNPTYLRQLVEDDMAAEDSLEKTL